MEFQKRLVLIFKLGLKRKGSKLMEIEEEDDANFRNLVGNDLVRDSKIDRDGAFADIDMADAPNVVQSSSTMLEDDMYDVEQIVGMKKVEGRWLYKIRWKGYGKGSDTWEPQENLTQCLDMIEEFKLQQQKKRKTGRATSLNRSKSEALSTSDETSSENVADGLPASETKTRNESQPDTFWKDLAEGRIPIRDEDMYSNVKGRRAKKNQNAQDSKTPSSHSSTSNDSTDRASANQDQTDFNLGVLQTLSHFFDNSLKAVDRLRKPEKDRAYRSCSKLSRDKHVTKKTSIMRVERVSCSPGKLMLKIKGHKVATSSYSCPLPNLLERKAHHNLRSKRISSTCTKNKVPVQNEPMKVNVNTSQIMPEMSPVKSESDIPTTSTLLKELFTVVKAGDLNVVDGLFKLYKEHMGADKIKFGHVTHQLLLEGLSSNNWEVMASLLQNGAGINSTSSDGTTILMAACQNANSEVVQKLLDRGAYKDKQNSLGMTALMIACSVGDSVSVYKLLNSGANFVIVNRAGISVLKLAKLAKNARIQNILTKHVSRVKACFETEVRKAVFSNADIMHALLPLNCYTINEQSEVKISFDYKKELDTDCVSGDGYIIFIANYVISEDGVSCKLDGVNKNCSVKSVILNEKKQELISLGTKVGYSCTPLHEGRNVLSILMEQSNQGDAKLLICAYKVRLETRS